MPKPHYRATWCCLIGLVGAGAAAAADGPTAALDGNAARFLETADASVTLQGHAQSQSGLAGVRWLNQFEQRGGGVWSEDAQHAATWSVPDIPLRPGVNLISVIVVDGANRSASVQVAVNRRPAAGASLAALPVGSGAYQNRPIIYQSWRGQAVIEGDIIVQLSPFVRPDAAPVAGSDAHTNGLGVNYIAQLWPKAGNLVQVPYVTTGANANLTAALNSFNQLFAGLIQFVAWSGQPNYVNIAVDSGGSGEGYSNVGMVGGEQTLECGSGCTVATWLHEMGHTVGLLHEHQRPDRAQYITLDLANADLPNVPGNFTLFAFDYQAIGLYDYASVMHYGAFDFSQAGQPVLESIPAGIPLGNVSGYSAGDVDQVERLYGATPSAVTVTTNPSGLQIVVDGVTYTAPQTFSFILNSAHQLSVPADPQYTSPADGSTYAFGNWNDLGASSHSISVAPGSGALAAPASAPAVTVYQANYIRLQPFGFKSPEAYPSGSGTIAVSPAPVAEFGGNFFTDRTLVKLTLTASRGYDFYDWFNLPYPPSDNPHSFYIQAPTTEAQAVLEPRSKPVTLVGKTMTGTNAWNPGLVAYVDNVFTLIPAGFTAAYDHGWGAGTTHTVSVDATQSPVTTNVYFDWNYWSDGGAITHTITQPTAGSQSVSASFTPYYASYTSPPPLGGAASSCAGGVSTSPPGAVYPVNPTFGFYASGTHVTATAAANPAFPAMLFADWSGSTGGLTGRTNPQATTIENQFVPTANFNLPATPLAITGLTPSSAAANAGAALNLVVTGTGFTSQDTYAYWNGSYRSLTYKKSTEIVVHLTAGDLASPGGQDLFVGNYTTNAANNTCGVGAETSFTVLE